MTNDIGINNQERAWPRLVRSSQGRVVLLSRYNVAHTAHCPVTGTWYTQDQAKVGRNVAPRLSPPRPAAAAGGDTSSTFLDCLNGGAGWDW